ncbi:MAG TPA: GH92 family glycosyl hydrolase [Bryobacteraceae bacterium]|nr:GH92 family glycosyl hydrolase [Bryobacteraceae bacterium]
MNRFLMVLALASAAFAADVKTSLADLPDPLVGTWSSYELSHGNTYPGVFTPFGMIGWTAQMSEGGWTYQYFRETIQGFLATHQPSAWMSNYGPFSIMPVTGVLAVLPGERASHFDHKNEKALPYLYSVLLDAYRTKVEMAPSHSGGAFRITFPKSEDAYIVLDAFHGGGAVEIDAKARTIRGKNSSGAGKSPNFAQYFVLQFDRDFTRSGTWENPEDARGRTLKGQSAAIQAGAAEREGNHVGAYAGFAPGETVSVRIGVSLIGPQQAARNLAADIGDAPFDSVVARAKSQWEQELARIEIRGGTAEQRRTFYTAMYHAVQFPHMLQETGAGGKMVHWSPYDGQVHAGEMFADNGFWDTFRAQFPLFTILEPKRDAEIIRAMLNCYDEGGFLPKWANPGETNVMIGTHGDSVIADAYMKGIRDYDANKAYDAVRKDATEKGAGMFEAKNGIEDYELLGFVPYDHGVGESVACTLEYAYDDFCAAQMAKSLGHTDDYRKFLERSKNYRNLYDPSVGFMRGRKSDRSWIEPFDPLAWGGVYTEGNAWQWLWSVQQDVPGLMELMGGKAAFVKKLDELFSTTPAFHVGGYGQVIHEMTEAKMAGTGQYAHINEPVHHVIYLYDYAGEPWKTQQWVHTVEDTLYKPGPAGWLGDEDTGQMSSWYIFSSLGFYPVNPGQPVYALGSPQFDHAVIHLENGKTFTVDAARTAPGDIYVQSVKLNGQPLDRPWITQAEIVGGGVLQFRLGREPNKSWGTSGMPTP